MDSPYNHRIQYTDSSSSDGEVEVEVDGQLYRKYSGSNDTDDDEEGVEVPCDALSDEEDYREAQLSSKFDVHSIRQPLPGQRPQRAHSGSKKSSAPKIYREVEMLTDVDLLFVGLQLVGFDVNRQRKVSVKHNIDRFKAFYGVPPTTAVPLLTDLREDNPGITFRDSLMTLNWLFGYDTYIVLSARWDRCEEYIGETVISHGFMIAKLRVKKILFQFKYDTEYKLSIDCCVFTVREMRLDPSEQWFDWKSHSAGLVSSTLCTETISLYEAIELNNFP